MVDTTRVTLTLTVDDPDQLAEAVVVLGDAAVRLAHLGHDVPLLIGPDTADDDEDPCPRCGGDHDRIDPVTTPCPIIGPPAPDNRTSTLTVDQLVYRGRGDQP